MIQRILIVGQGSIGKRHLLVSRKLFPNAKIAVLRHKENQPIPDGVDDCFFTVRAAVSFDPDIVAICNPSSLHIETALAFLNIGAHFLIEKPLSSVVEEALKFIKIHKNSKSKILVGYNLRFMNSLMKFKQLLDSNILGDIYSVNSIVGQYLPAWRKDINYKQTVSSQKSLGGGVILELSHEIDYLTWIFGKVNWVESTLGCQSNLKLDVEDTALITIGIESVNKEILVSLNMDFVRHDPVRTCTVVGNKGTLRWNGITGTVESFTEGSTDWTLLVKDENSIDQTYIDEWLHLVEAISLDKNPDVSLNEGYEVLKIVEAIRLADKNHSRSYMRNSN